MGLGRRLQQVFTRINILLITILVGGNDIMQEYTAPVRWSKGHLIPMRQQTTRLTGQAGAKWGGEGSRVKGII
jgi:hypothetical protein